MDRLDRARRLAAELGNELAELAHELDELAAEREWEQVWALWQSMRPATPPQVPDHVPAQWSQG